jgi:ribokinase
MDIPDSYERPPAVVLGDALVDYVCKVDEMPMAGGDAQIRSCERRPGGAGLNASVCLASLKVSCCLVTAVGDDENGRYLTRHLAAAGVDSSHIRSTGTTGYVISFADSGGERTMFSYRGASSTPMEMTPALERALDHTPLLMVSGYCLQDDEQAKKCLNAAQRVRRTGGMVAFDPTPVVGRLAIGAVERMLEATQVLLCNSRELQTLTGCEAVESGIRAILQRVPCIGVKLGRRGSIVALRRGTAAHWSPGDRSPDSAESEPEILRCPTRPVRAADTTGVGDAFNAGFLAALLYGSPLSSWGVWGNVVAAKVIMSRGVSRDAQVP